MKIYKSILFIYNISSAYEIYEKIQTIKIYKQYQNI